MTRHGPAVLQVCRAVLQDPHEADDAFQATFLVLVRKAPSIQNPESLGGWLRGVAYRTATRARCRAARRRVIERNCAELPRSECVPDELTPELRDLVRQELDRLPDTYRLPGDALLPARDDPPGGGPAAGLAGRHGQGPAGASTPLAPRTARSPRRWPECFLLALVAATERGVSGLWTVTEIGRWGEKNWPRWAIVTRSWHSLAARWRSLRER